MHSTDFVDYYDANKQELDLVNFLFAEDVNRKRKRDERFRKASKKFKIFVKENLTLGEILGSLFGGQITA